MNQHVAAPLFVLGAPRSGTSLLYRTLALHPDAAWISNYGRRLTMLPEVAVLNRIARLAPHQRQQVWFGEEGDNAYRYGAARGAVERLFPQPVEGEPLFERRGVLQGLDRTGCGRRQLRLRNDVRRLVRASGSQVLVSKRIGHNRRVGLLHEIFPEARFVVMSRDGRAVARSLLAVDWWPDSLVWWFGGTPRDWSRAGGDPRDLAAHHWVREVDAIETGLALVPEHQVQRITYEDLVAAPHDVITDVARFAGLDDDHGWTAALGRVRFPNRNGTGEPDERVTAIQGETLRALGYAA
ncbi:sulfotransferase [Nocardioides sp. SR21]|uniref:sulfotransferase family protein n=1 Tax=Nocardioides sp. SR21 TaxID=2919501 RepID=UPI001FA96638|nr:sulfotransferase [Nocardioides sp. SR21]